MNLKDFKWVIGDLNFYSVIFDSCHMATAEVYEELKDCYRFFAASPTEMPAEGLRYEFLNPDGEYDFDAGNYDYDLSLFGDLFRVSRDYYAQQPIPLLEKRVFFSIWKVFIRHWSCLRRLPEKIRPDLKWFRPKQF